MYRNHNNHVSHIAANRSHTVNRKRSQRWISDETRLFSKYGLNGRYLHLYVL